MGRDDSVGIATRYGLDGPGIEFRWGRDFSQPPIPALGPKPIQWVPGIDPGGKLSGRGVTHPPPSSSKVKERVEVCSYFPLGLYGLFWDKLYLYLYIFFLLITVLPECFKGCGCRRSFAELLVKIRGQIVLGAASPYH